MAHSKAWPGRFARAPASSDVNRSASAIASPSRHKQPPRDSKGRKLRSRAAPRYRQILLTTSNPFHPSSLYYNPCFAPNQQKSLGCFCPRSNSKVWAFECPPNMSRPSALPARSRFWPLGVRKGNWHGNCIGKDRAMMRCGRDHNIVIDFVIVPPQSRRILVARSRQCAGPQME